MKKIALIIGSSLFLLFSSGYAQEEEIPETLETFETLEIPETPFPIEDYFYSDQGKRDPFTPLIRKSVKEQRKRIINIENIYMIGTIQTKKGEIIALVKEKGGKGHILKTGDPVAEGEVEEIGSDFITFILTRYGLETRRTLRLREGTWSGLGK